MSLISAARLTDEEIHSAVDCPFPPGHEGIQQMLHMVADAATAKALWAVYDWLTEHSALVTDGNGFGEDAEYVLGVLLEQAGIERPKEVTSEP